MNTLLPPALPCMCASLRRAARAITQLYEQELRTFGVTASQFTILQVLDRAAELSQGQLGSVLAMDSTTLTRTLRIMLRHGWLAERRGQDRRERRLRLARAGQLLLKRALPRWQELQSRLRRRVGGPAWDELLQMTHRVTELISNGISDQGDSL